MSDKEEFDAWFKFKYKNYYSNGADKICDFSDYELFECWQACAKRKDAEIAALKRRINLAHDELLRGHNDKYVLSILDGSYTLL